MYIPTTNGKFHYNQHLLYFGDHSVNRDNMMDNIELLSEYFEKIGINWGPAFGTLIGIVRNNDFLPWNPVFDIYILKEDEERFKELLLQLSKDGFSLVRHERKGLYYLLRKGEFIKIFILRKICSNVRHTGGKDFILEKYVQNFVKWNFNGVDFNVPIDVDEYLSSRYGNWYVPRQTVFYKIPLLNKYKHWCKVWIQDHLPDSLYYRIEYLHLKKDFQAFRLSYNTLGLPISSDIQLSYTSPRKYKRILTVGVYDILHKGHIELFRRAKGLGDYLIVAVQDGDYITKYKPSAKVICSTSDRMYMVKSIRYVDEVVTYTDVDTIVTTIDFDVLVTGPDQCHSGFQRAIKWCEDNGKEHIILGRTAGISSSEIKSKIEEKSKQYEKN